MKKSVKATALILAFSVLLTGCAGSPASNKHTQFERTEKSDKVYQKAEITQVKDKEFSVSDKTGLYTGDWKGNRPEGEGTLVISENEYYSGTWENGYLSGQGEIKTLDESGGVRYFKGECAYNVPSGQGQLTMGDIDSGTFMILDGSFDGESSLVYFMITDNTLADIGDYTGGDLISYVGNYNVSGISRKKGEYFGQTDENGIANGYGYYRENNGNPNAYKEYCALGTWKDGELDGYYSTLYIDRGNTTKYVDRWYGREEVPSTWSTAIKETGCLRDGQEVGVYIRTSSYDNDPKDDRDGVYVESKDYDTGITLKAEHWINGTHIYEWHNAFNTEAEYWKYDKDGNLLINSVTQDGQWTELVNKEKEAKEAQQRLTDKCTKFGIIAGTIALPLAGYYLESLSFKNWRNSSALTYLANTQASYAFSAEAERMERDAARMYDNGDKAGAELKMQEANSFRANYHDWTENWKELHPPV